MAKNYDFLNVTDFSTLVSFDDDDELLLLSELSDWLDWDDSLWLLLELELELLLWLDEDDDEDTVLVSWVSEPATVSSFEPSRHTNA